MPRAEAPAPIAPAATAVPIATFVSPTSVAPTPIAGPGLVAPAPASSGPGLVVRSVATTANAVIPGTDFTIIDRPKRKAVILLFGDGGTGKTTFGIRYAPQPAFLIGFDGRSQYVEELAKQAGHPVPAVQIAPPSVLQKSDNVKLAAQEALAKFFRNFDGAIQASLTGQVRTLVLDTGSELGEIITLAVRGTLESAKGDYGRSKDQINQIWWKIFGSARFTGNCHLIVLSRASSIWENNEPTGDFRARVSDTVRDAVDFSLHLRFGYKAPAITMPGMAGMAAIAPGTPGLVAGGGLIAAPAPGLTMGGVAGPRPAKEFELVVKKSGNTNPIEDVGLVFRESDWGEIGPFAYACSRLMPGSQPEDWR